ncbi:MAG: hypothetical protein LBO62_08035, partial [Endomicrobium sp.]|nr:hypothetical protein [Endomicrobium sp.]
MNDKKAARKLGGWAAKQQQRQRQRRTTNTPSVTDITADNKTSISALLYSFVFRLAAVFAFRS